MSLLKEIMAKKGIVYSHQTKIVSPKGEFLEGWIFDLRRIFFLPDSLDILSGLIWKKLEPEYPFQIGGQELSAIPLISAIILKSRQAGKPISGFVLRKSRKKVGLQKIIEGEITDEKIIIVDDLVNSGSTIFKIASVLESMDKKIHSIIAIVDFENKIFQEKVRKYNLLFSPLFKLSEFGLSLKENRQPKYDNFRIVWKFKSPDPSFFHIVPKSCPAIDEKNLYFGSDCGIFWAIDQKNGEVVWKFEVGYPVTGKSIFSSPAILKDTVFFGSYDGNFYALDKKTGKMKWKNMDADFIGSSPTISPELGLVFVGLEFGLFKKKGGVTALDVKTGKSVWKFEASEFIHSSPAYCPKNKTIFIGGNDSAIRAFDAKNGKLRWSFRTDGPIKASFAIDARKNLVAFGSFDKNLYVLNMNSGSVAAKFTSRDCIYSTPLFWKNNIIFASLDKNLYSLNLESWKLNWRVDLEGRIFSSPTIIQNRIFIGSCNGRMFEIDPEKGNIISFLQLSERITNQVVSDQEEKDIFLTTYANEIYCLRKS